MTQETQATEPTSSTYDGEEIELLGGKAYAYKL